MTVKEKITWMKENNYFHHWLLPMNIFKDMTPYAGRPVGNSPEFTTLDKSLNREILHILRFHCVLRRFVLDGEGTDKEKSNMRFGFYTKGNFHRNQAYMGINNGNTFFSKDFPRC